MNAHDYEYRGLVAKSWDRMREPLGSPDQGLYWEIIQDSGEPALIVGCGTGHLTLESASNGLMVDGVDKSPEMVEIAKKRREPRNLHPIFIYSPRK